MSYADIRFQRIENNINELKESIKFLSDIMHDHLLDKNNQTKNDDNNDKNNDDNNDENNDENNDKNDKNDKKKDKKKQYLGSRLMEWVKSPSTIIYSTSFIIGAFTSYGLYHFYDKK
jgi:ABC-type antimicrobial peptide transport system permease subunit